MQKTSFIHKYYGFLEVIIKLTLTRELQYFINSIIQYSRNTD